VEIYAHALKHVWTNYFTKAFGVELDVPPAAELGASFTLSGARAFTGRSMASSSRSRCA
jgi:hypothetical protein